MFWFTNTCISFKDHSCVFLIAHSEEMNISSEIFNTDGSNSSDQNYTGFAKITVDIISILLGFPINS